MNIYNKLLQEYSVLFLKISLKEREVQKTEGRRMEAGNRKQEAEVKKHQTIRRLSVVQSAFISERINLCVLCALCAK